MRTVTLTEPGLEGRYLVEGPDESGKLELRPEPSLAEVLDEMDGRLLSADEVAARHSHLPSDDEG